MMIFPRVNFKDNMIKGAPASTIGVANPSGWMTGDIFVQWLRHFIQHSHSSTEHPVLLLMDNHDSHITIDSLNLAKENGITLLTFPPHCSHKLQPLDRSVYGPLKRYYNAACDSWLLQNPGKPMTIYDIAENFGKAFPRAFNAENITSGFRVSGVYPYDRHIFPDDEFLGSFVTDRPPNATTDASLDTNTDISAPTTSPESGGGPSPSDAVLSETSPSGTQYLSPSDVRPFVSIRCQTFSKSS